MLRLYWKTLIGTCGACFLYDFVTSPNGVFSGIILFSIVDKTGTKGKVIGSTAGWKLLLGALALTGVFVGAILCKRLGWENIMMLALSGSRVFGRIIGRASDQTTKIITLFVVFYGFMQSSGNPGPADMLSLLSFESYATAFQWELGTALALP